MMIRYWNPATDLFNTPMDRLFDSLLEDQDLGARTTWTPAIALTEGNDAFELTCYLPGVIAEDLDVQVMQESVSISGMRNKPELSEGDRYLYSDVAYGQFRRLVQLPAKIQNTQVEASFEQGVLSLRLPKHEAEKHKVVKLSLGGEKPQLEVTEPTVDTEQS